MNLNYLDFYQNISKENVTKSTLAFLGDFRSRKWENEEEKQRVLNKFSIQSALNHHAEKTQDEVTLHNATFGLKSIIEELSLIKIKILVVVSDNADRDNLTPGQEIKEIEKQLNPEHNPIFEFKVLLNADIQGLITNLIKFEPHILHFTGHGEEEGIYLSEEDSSTSALLKKDTFVNILKHLDSSLYLIFFNSCKSATLADEIHQFRNNIYIISYNDYIEVEQATKISNRFYKRLYETKSFKSAINLFSLDTERRVNPHMEKTIQEKLHLNKIPEQARSVSKRKEIEYRSWSDWLSIKGKAFINKCKRFFARYFKRTTISNPKSN